MSQFNDLGGVIKIALKIRTIRDENDEGWFRNFLNATEKDVTRHLFVQ